MGDQMNQFDNGNGYNNNRGNQSGGNGNNGGGVCEIFLRDRSKACGPRRYRLEKGHLYFVKQRHVFDS